MGTATVTPTSEFSKGLDGVIAAQTRLSKVAGEEGKLYYCGYTIQDLASNASFEEVCYLLWNLRLPNATELAALKKELASFRELPKPVIELLKKFPRDAHPRVALRSAISALGAFDPDGDDMSAEANRRKAKRLVAQTATAVAAWDRIRKGQEPVKPDPKLSHAGNFLWMLFEKKPLAEDEHFLDVALVLHADHDMNASTFAARVTCATLSDMHSAITSAVGTLKGPLHGGANQQVMEVLLRLGEVAKIEPYVKEQLAKHEKIAGFGHRVYRTTDPRAPLLAGFSATLAKRAGESRWYDMSKKLEDVMVREKQLYPNVDLWSASVFYMMKIPVDLFSAVFAVSRVAGWTAHVLEQLADNRLMRPRAEFLGELGRAWVPIEKR
jgi:citrate synthase